MLKMCMNESLAKKNDKFSAFGTLPQFSTSALYMLNKLYKCIVCEINPYYSLQCILLILYRYATNILKMCMNKFDAKKMIFDKFAGF